MKRQSNYVNVFMYNIVYKKYLWTGLAKNAI